MQLFILTAQVQVQLYCYQSLILIVHAKRKCLQCINTTTNLAALPRKVAREGHSILQK